MLGNFQCQVVLLIWILRMGVVGHFLSLACHIACLSLSLRDNKDERG
ncbi:MAG: hypothetical protein AB2693_15890 [Candidatus Thiodiazotropha sp.]